MKDYCKSCKSTNIVVQIDTEGAHPLLYSTCGDCNREFMTKEQIMINQQVGEGLVSETDLYKLLNRG